MLAHLIESGPHTRTSTPGGTFVSLATHAGIIVLAIQLTATAAREVDRVVAEHVTFAQVKASEPPPQKQAAPPPANATVTAILPAKGFQILTAPIKIPNVLPDIDLGRSLTREEDFSGRGVAGGVATGVVGGMVRRADEATHAYFEYEVETPAKPYPDNRPPRFPESARAAQVQGSVTAQWVVDTTGHADMSTLRFLHSTNNEFERAVREVLGTWRFRPAEIGGRKVRMLVEQPFEFQFVER